MYADNLDSHIQFGFTVKVSLHLKHRVQANILQRIKQHTIL